MGIRFNVTAFLVGSGIAVLVLALRAKAAAELPPPEVVEPPIFVEPIIQPPVEVVEIPPEVERAINVTIPDPLEVAVVAVGI